MYLRAFNPTIVRIPPREDFYIGSASAKLFLPIFKMNFPEIVDIALPAQGVFHNLVFVSIRKTYPDASLQNHARPPGMDHLIHKLLAAPPTA